MNNQTDQQYLDSLHPATSGNQFRRDDLLWQIAKKRVSFKWGLVAYLFVNTFLVGVWYFSSKGLNYFWPIWPILGWGVGLAFHYFDAYHGNKLFSAEQEYEKLKNKHGR